MVEDAQWARAKLEKLYAPPLPWSMRNLQWTVLNYGMELRWVSKQRALFDGEDRRLAIGVSNLLTLILMGGEAIACDPAHIERAAAQAFELGMRSIDGRSVWDSAVLLQPEVVAAMLDVHAATHLSGAWSKACVLMRKQLR